jgi:lipopolysaccharide/colanic/teichoic acid biosynthesis glycosyltransferase
MAIVTILGAFASTIIGKIAADEAKAWLPRLSRFLVDRAIRRLPDDYRARYTEEWESDILELPGELSRVIYSAGLVKAASNIRKVSRGQSISYTESFAKRSFDLLFATMALGFGLPFIWWCLLVVKFESSGPCVVMQMRTGKDRSPFSLQRIRTRYMHSRHITRFGSFLRTTHLDELPQLVNVLKGEMSIVGPRPIFPAEVELYDEREMIRFAVKPGITGYAQLLTQGEFSLGKAREMDAYYASNASFLLDMKIMFMTVTYVLFGSRTLGAGPQ